MKNKIQITFSKIMFALSIFIFSLLLSKTGFAQASYEVQCRTKAKEIAAETYKGCMTEQRQAQIEQIRKDYKDKLSKLKNHYDKELKKLSGGSVQMQQTAALNNGVEPSNEQTGPEITLKKLGSKNTKTRSSGARLPQKKTGVAATQTQVIDMSAPIDSQINTPAEESVQSQSRMKSSDENDAEVVDLQSQE